MSVEKEYKVARRIHMRKEEECRQLRFLFAWVKKFLLFSDGYSRKYIANEIFERLKQIDNEFSNA